MFSRSLLPTLTCPAEGRVQPGEDIEQGALAAAAGPHNGDQLSHFHLQVYAAQRDYLEVRSLVNLEQVSTLDVQVVAPGLTQAVALYGAGPSRYFHGALPGQLHFVEPFTQYVSELSNIYNSERLIMSFRTQ